MLHPGHDQIVRRSTLLMPEMVDYWLDEWLAVLRHCTPVSRALFLAAAHASTSSVLANDAGERSSGIAGTNATMLTLCCASLRCELQLCMARHLLGRQSSPVQGDWQDSQCQSTSAHCRDMLCGSKLLCAITGSQLGLHLANCPVACR